MQRQTNPVDVDATDMLSESTDLDALLVAILGEPRGAQAQPASPSQLDKAPQAVSPVHSEPPGEEAQRIVHSELDSRPRAGVTEHEATQVAGPIELGDFPAEHRFFTPPLRPGFFERIDEDPRLLADFPILRLEIEPDIIPANEASTSTEPVGRPRRFGRRFGWPLPPTWFVLVAAAAAALVSISAFSNQADDGKEQSQVTIDAGRASTTAAPGSVTTPQETPVPPQTPGGPTSVVTGTGAPTIKTSKEEPVARTAVTRAAPRPKSAPRGARRAPAKTPARTPPPRAKRNVAPARPPAEPRAEMRHSTEQPSFTSAAPRMAAEPPASVSGPAAPSAARVALQSAAVAEIAAKPAAPDAAIAAGSHTTISSGPLRLPVTANAVDPDGDVLAYRWSAPTGVFANPAERETIFICPPTPGAISVTLTVSDGKGGSASDTLTIQCVTPAREDQTFDIAHSPNFL